MFRKNKYFNLLGDIFLNFQCHFAGSVIEDLKNRIEVLEDRLQITPLGDKVTILPRNISSLTVNGSSITNLKNTTDETNNDSTETSFATFTDEYRDIGFVDEEDVEDGSGGGIFN